MYGECFPEPCVSFSIVGRATEKEDHEIPSPSMILCMATVAGSNSDSEATGV